MKNLPRYYIGAVHKWRHALRGRGLDICDDVWRRGRGVLKNVTSQNIITNQGNENAFYKGCYWAVIAVFKQYLWNIFSSEKKRWHRGIHGQSLNPFGLMSSSHKQKTTFFGPLVRNAPVKGTSLSQGRSQGFEKGGSTNYFPSASFSILAKSS